MNRKSWTTMNRTNAIKRAERGDAGTYGTTAYMPFIFFVVVFGIFIAMLGFWRQMTVAANERGSYRASTEQSTSAGQSEASSMFGSLTSGNGAGGSSSTSSAGGRTVTTNTQADTTIEMPVFGRTEGVVLAQSQKRWEQFYAGPKECTGATCEE